MPKRTLDTHHSRCGTFLCLRRNAFTLVELLIVLVIFLLVSAIALPTFRELLNDQKVSKSSRTIVAYLNEARSRAVADGRFVGVRFERIGSVGVIDFQNSAVARMRQLVGVPPYTGEAADAKVTFLYPTPPVPPAITPDPTTATLQFRGVDNQLLLLYNNSTSSLFNDPAAPIANGDLIELPGGRLFPLTFTGYASGTDIVTATIDLNSTINGSNTFPILHVPATGAQVAYRIFRSPVVSTSKSLTLPRGIVVDTTFSGIGIDGNQFAAVVGGGNQPIDIIFGPDGRVESSSIDSIGTLRAPNSLIYLCIGSTDGVQAATPFNATNPPSNLVDTESVWVVINPTTGRSVVSPTATVSTTTSIALALRQARSLASLSDTLDANP